MMKPSPSFSPTTSLTCSTTLHSKNGSKLHQPRPPQRLGKSRWSKTLQTIAQSLWGVGWIQPCTACNTTHCSSWLRMEVVGLCSTLSQTWKVLQLIVRCTYLGSSV
eukprot:PhF_6_TR36137/c0_g1_i1/m.52489